MTVTLTAPSEAGSLQLQVQNQAPTLSVSAPVQLFVSPTSAGTTQNLPLFSVDSYFASGSAQIYSCSGNAGSYVLTCDQPALDFKPQQGIRIVGAGPVAANPAITTQPTITEITPYDGQASGTHQYCYVVYAADAEGGISNPSPESCIANEPSLSYTTAYNMVGGTYSLPLAAFLFYVSEDGSPFRLFSVNGGMDVGQEPGSRGGWPTPYPVSGPGITKNQDLFTSVAAVSDNQITLHDPLATSIVEAEVDHDDAAAIQSAINAAGAVGGGIVQLDDGTYNVRRPAFGYWISNTTPYNLNTTSYKLKPNFAGYSNLYIPNGSTGSIYIQGDGASTVLQTPPDFGGYGTLLAIGAYSSPAYAPFTSIKIEEVDKGSTTITLTPDHTAAGLHVGNDVWLYSGNFNGGGSCVDLNNTAGGNCHFSELNTVKAIDGNTVTLLYPTSKKFYDDGTNSFGLVMLPVTPHNIAIQNLTVDTSDPIFGSGMVYGLLVNHVTVKGSPTHGAFMGGFKRDVLIENSSWSIGAGDTTWTGTEELDQYTNVAFVNNTITDYSASGAGGPSGLSRIYLTEGTSEVVFEGNRLSGASILFQDTTDDVIDNNQFDDAFVSVGLNYNPFNHPFFWGSPQDQSFLSFGSQEAAEIGHNVFNVDANVGLSYIINLGHFTSGEIDNNVILNNNTHAMAAINSDGGGIESNQITIGPSSTMSWGIAAIPDEGPGVDASEFVIQHNTITATDVSAGIRVVNSGFTDTAPVCIRENTINIQRGQLAEQVASSTADLSCDGIAP